MSDSSLVFEPPVIARSGACARMPENTMAAFKAAREDGATWVEADVTLTSDGVPVLMHDDTLDRTTNGHGSVADASWADLRALDAGGWFAPSFIGTPIPMLVELLAFARDSGLRLNLDLKPCPGRTQATVMVTLIETAKLLWPDNAPPPLISSFDIDALVLAARLHPDWPRGLLLDAWRDDWRELMTRTQATALNINADILTADRVHMLRETGVPILAYTVNDPARAKALLHQGVRAVFTDDPAAIIKAL